MHIVKQLLREQDEKDLEMQNLQNAIPEPEPEEEPELTPIDPTGDGTIDPNSPLEPKFDEPEIQSVEDISTIDAKNLIEASKGKIFTVWFIKKDNNLREMNARLGVKAYLKGGELPYDPVEKGLIPVFDLQIKRYRMINWTTIKKLKINGREYNVR